MRNGSTSANGENPERSLVHLQVAIDGWPILMTEVTGELHRL
jgi:hypothetical protein